MKLHKPLALVGFALMGVFARGAFPGLLGIVLTVACTFAFLMVADA